jgi:arsenate reductase (thioredoxin)
MERLALLALLVQETVAMTASGFELNPELGKYVESCERELELIPAERRAILDQLARYVADCHARKETARIVFICTHNSRRSQLAQIWGAAAAARHRIEDVETYSGGTEVTAFNPRSIAALSRAGWKIEGNSTVSNPHYHVKSHSGGETWECFSKVYNQPPNPNSRFCAVMTCSDADEACPSIPGASHRIALPYNDPRMSDDSPEETVRYDAVCRQIAREMLYVFSPNH